MVARAPGKAILALPLLIFLVAVVLVLTARNVTAPSEVHILPIVVHTATIPQASSAPPADHGSPAGISSPAQQPRPGAAPPSSKVKTGGATDRASSCTSLHCPR